MQRQSYLNSLILLLTSAIWGFSFVAQRNGMEYVGPFTFNGIRFALGAASLLPFYYYLKRKKEVSETKISDKVLKKGMFLGIVLFIAASLQQIGMIYTTAANGGFITSLYVVLVPFFLLLQKKKISKNVWIGAFIAVIGLYLLSVHGNLSINTGDSLVLISAVFWAIHVILIGRYASGADIVLLAIIQFTATALFSLTVAFIIEDIFIHTVLDAAVPIIYGGVFSVGIAYTLQIIAQKKVVAEQAAIILSFESAFAMLGGWLILSETLSVRSLIGAGFMLTGIIISQIRWKKKTI
jgi:drug/metabolite transporter (DMT)-like permease